MNTNASKLVGLILAALLALSSLPASAKSHTVSALPFAAGESARLDRKQDAVTNVTISKGGVVTVTSRFSNGRRYDGDNFASTVTVYSESGQILATLRLAKGLNGTYGGRTRVGTVKASKQLPRGVKPGRVTITHSQFDKVNDLAVWDVIETVVSMYATGQTFDRIGQPRQF